MGFHYVDSVGSTPYVPSYGYGYGYGGGGGAMPAPQAPVFNLPAAPTIQAPTPAANTPAAETPAANGDAQAATQTPANTTVSQDIDDFYGAIQGGTDDDEFERVLNKINKDNVMDYVCTWNKNYSSVKGESFMEAFMWDADSDQKEKYGRKIAAALRDHAQDIGCYDELEDEFGDIFRELDSVCYISNDIASTYDEVIEKIAEAENKEGGEAKSCSSSVTGFFEDCKEYGLLGNTVALVGGSVCELGKAIWDFVF